MITAEQIREIFPESGKIADLFAPHINAACEEFEINTPLRIAAFVAQTGHESGGFRKLEENLSYSAERLTKVWPNRFPTIESAMPYARNPIKLANKVYAGRNGNGDENSGAGWRHRGSGILQLTFYNNQKLCADHFKIHMNDIGDWLRTPEGACRSAAHFWHVNKLNWLADGGKIGDISRKINGGDIGIAERIKLYEKAKKVLGA